MHGNKIKLYKFIKRLLPVICAKVKYMMLYVSFVVIIHIYIVLELSVNVCDLSFGNAGFNEVIIIIRPVHACKILLK